MDINSFSKRIFLFTNEENPMSENARNQEEAIERGQKLTEKDIEIELFPMSNPHEEKTKFDVDLYFSNIVNMEDSDLEDAYLRIQDLSKRIRLKEFKKRVLGKCMFSMTKSMNVGLKFYNLTKTTKKPTAKFINKSTGKELKSLTKYTCKESGKTLYKSQIGSHYPVKKQKVMISELDMKKIKHFEASGMKLIGFKSKDSIKIYQNIRPSYFIYPDEKVMKGSSKTFHAMIESLIKKNKVAYVRFVPREGAMVRFCYLVPQKEKRLKQDSEEYSPPGFHLIFIPYAEDMRNLEEEFAHKEKLAEINKEDGRAAKLFVKNMTVDFNSRNFENPSIQKFYSGLQSMALEEKQPEEVQDTLEPDREGMKAMQKVVDHMKDVFKLDAIPKRVIKEKKPKRKREEDKEDSKEETKQEAEGEDVQMEIENGNESNQDSPPKPSRGKRVKKENMNDENIEIPKVYSDTKIKEMINSDEMINLSVKVLREA